VITPETENGRGLTALLVFLLGLGVVSADLFIGGSDLLPGVALTTIPYWAVGALLIWRRSRNRVGWVLVAFALLWSMTFLGLDYAQVAFGRGWPGAVLAAWIGEWTWLPALLTVFVVIPILFPTGRPLSPRWGIAIKAVLGFAIVFVLATSLQRFFEGDVLRPNPLAYLPIDDAESVLLPIAVPLLLVGPWSTVVRYRRSRGQERQQLRWFVFSVVLFLVIFVLNAVFEPATLFFDSLVLASLAAPAIAIGIAIMRYRLFEIDRIISRTVTYGLVTGLLVAIYAGTVFLISGLAPDSGSLAVAAATLLAAALFAPVRRQAQAWVDKKFNRSHYDARVTIDELSTRLRSSVDVSTLGLEVGQVVTATMQPERLLVWIR
jgi:hypothetical protein